MIDRSLRTISHALLLVAAMLALIAAGLWFHDAALEPRAVARQKTISPGRTGVPDSGRQRQMIVEELKKLNTRMQGIEAALRNGEYVIQTKPVAGEAGAAGGGP